MSCSFAIPSSSPAFSPSRIPPSLFSQDGPPPAASCSSSSPFRPRFQRPPPSGLRSSSSSSLKLPETSPSPKKIAGVPLLKRKRPPRIDIPAAGDALRLACSDAPPAPATTKVSEVEEEGERFSVFCKRGRKGIEMEDRHVAETHLAGDPQLAFFGIFDGHGGSRAAEFASRNLGRRIAAEIREGGGEKGLEEAVRDGYLRTDEEFSKEDLGGGACCVTALLSGGDLVVSNAGDGRAVLCRGGVAEALTVDHRPSREDERLRIESLGGYVECRRGAWRVQGCLAVSRGIGDTHLKPWVVAEPETTTVAVSPDCEFLILASDGLWDKVGNQEAVDIARPMIFSGGDERPSVTSACKELANLSAARGSFDDISVMIVLLSSSSSSSSSSSPSSSSPSSSCSSS